MIEVHEPATLAGVEKWLSAASQGDIESWAQLRQALGAAVGTGDKAETARHELILRTGLAYHLDMRAGGFFLTVAADPVRFPTTAENVPAEVTAIWAAYAATCTHDLLAGRLHHLVAHGAGDYRHAAKAAARYTLYARAALGLSEDDQLLPILRAWVALEALAAAVALSARYGHASELKAAGDACLIVARRSLAAVDPAPGLVIEALRPLVRIGAKHRGAWVPLVDGVLEAAETKFADQPYAVRAILTFSRMEVPQRTEQQRRGLEQRIVQTFIDGAAARTGATRQMELVEGALFAKQYQHWDLVEALTTKLQAVDPLDLRTQIARIEMQIPTELFDLAQKHVDQFPTLGDALKDFANQPAPANPADADLIQPATPERPFAKDGFLRMPVLRMDGSGWPITLRGEDDADNGLRTKMLVDGMRLRSIFLAHHLDCIERRFQPRRPDIAQALDLSGYTAWEVNDLATAIEGFWSPYPHLQIAGYRAAIAWCEPLLRRVATLRGLPVIVLQEGNSAGGVSMLGNLLNQLKDQPWADRGWTLSLKLLLSEPDGGFNLRNAVSHLRPRPQDRHHYALLLHTLLHLIGQVEAASP